MLDGRLTVAFRATLTPAGMDPEQPQTPIGTIERDLDLTAGTVVHQELSLPLQYQGLRIGTDCVRRSVELYDQLGVRTVDLEADWYGKYVWAMCGFEFRYPGSLHRVVDEARRFAERLPLERPLDFSTVRFPWEIASLGELVTYRDIAEALDEYVEEDALDADDLNEEIPVGKAIMLRGVPVWEGRLHLAPNRLGRRMFDLYTDPHA